MTTHDYRPNIEELLVETNRLRPLALTLIFDEHLAEDLLQEILSRAMGRRFRDLRHLQRWLALTLGNLAKETLRSGRNSDARERTMARHEAVESAEQVVVKRETIQLLNGALRTLPEPYGSTVRRLFLDGVSAGEAALLDGVRTDLIYQRKNRGLKLLREDLDRRAGGREGWVGACAILVSDPRRVQATRSWPVVPLAGLAASIAAVIMLATSSSDITEPQLAVLPDLERASKVRRPLARHEEPVLSWSRSRIEGHSRPAQGQPQSAVVAPSIDFVEEHGSVVVAQRMFDLPRNSEKVWLRAIVQTPIGDLLVADYESGVVHSVDPMTGLILAESRFHYLSTLATRDGLVAGVAPMGELCTVEPNTLEPAACATVPDDGAWTTNGLTIDVWRQIHALSTSPGLVTTFDEQLRELITWIPPAGSSAFFLGSDRYDSVIYTGARFGDGTSRLFAERIESPATPPNSATRREVTFSDNIADLSPAPHGGVLVVFESAKLVALPNPYATPSAHSWDADATVDLRARDSTSFTPSRMAVDLRNDLLWVTCERPSREVLGFPVAQLL